MTAAAHVGAVGLWEGIEPNELCTQTRTCFTQNSQQGTAPWQTLTAARTSPPGLMLKCFLFRSQNLHPLESVSSCIGSRFQMDP